MELSVRRKGLSGREAVAIGANGLRFTADEAIHYQKLRDIGIVLPDQFLHKAMDAYSFAMDSQNIQQTITTPSIATFVQFLQAWLPGFVPIVTAARKLDQIIGVRTIGEFESEQIVQPVLENTAPANPYSDLGNVPYASWNLNVETRTVVRFESGLRVGRLEEMRAAKMRISSAQTKRNSAALQLEVMRNLVGFYGFNNGAGRTYGLLNDPNLPAAVTVAATGTGSSTLWANKSYLNIINDIQSDIVRLRNGSQDQIDPETVDITYCLATQVVDRLSTPNTIGSGSVRDWMTENYPRIRVISCPQFNNANGGANVSYMFAEKLADGGTDGGETFEQLVPTKFIMLGASQQTKGIEEDFGMASAGTLLKRPYAVVISSGM